MTWLAIAAATLATSFLSGILGMAGGMILMGVLLALLPLSAAMWLHGVVQFASNGWRALLLRGQIDWRVTAGYALGAVLAFALFVTLRLVVDKAVALLVLGITPFVALALPQRWHLNVQRRGHPLACGLVCVSLSLTAGVSGPILDVFFVRSTQGRHAVVATKAITQALSHALKVIYFGAVIGTAAAGAPDHAAVTAWFAGTLVSLAFVGTTLSRGVLERISDASFRRWTRWAVGGIGVLYLVSGVRMLLS